LIAVRSIDIPRNIIMHVDIIEDARELTQLGGEWDALARGVPFRLHAWLAGWWRHYGEGKRLHVLAVRDAQRRLIGIAPWYVESSAVWGRTIRQLGTGEVCSDFLSLLAAPGEDDRVAETLAAHVCRHRSMRWDCLRLEGVDAEDTLTAHFVQTIERFGRRVYRRPVHRCWRLDLTGGWEAVLARQSKSHRKQLRRLESRVLQSKRVVLRRAEDEQQLARLWPQLVDLHQRRRQALDEPGCFASRRFADFHEQVSRQLLAAGTLRLVVLELDGQPAAAEYQLAGDGVTYAYQAGVNPELLDEQPGKLIMIATIRQAIRDGQHAFDLLRGDEPYKPHWRAEPRQAFEYRASNAHTSANMRHVAWLLGRNLKHLLIRPADTLPKDLE